MGLFSRKEEIAPIKKVKVLGVRMAQETKVLGTVNSTLYSILIECENGDRYLKEIDGGEMSKYLKYINMD